MSDQKSIHIIQSEKLSLYELIHQCKNAKTLTNYCKMYILINLAKILNTFHTLKHKPIVHGHLSSHNIFVWVPSDQK